MWHRLCAMEFCSFTISLLQPSVLMILQQWKSSDKLAIPFRRGWTCDHLLWKNKCKIHSSDYKKTYLTNDNVYCMYVCAVLAV